MEKTETSYILNEESTWSQGTLESVLGNRLGVFCLVYSLGRIDS
jgi:hypothetical protein